MLFTLQHLSLPGLIAALTTLFVLYYLIGPIFDPLREIPGPRLTRYTRLWELYHAWQGRLEQVHIALHKQYGPIVRVAPNRYSINDQKAVRTIYGSGSKFRKSDYYNVFGPPTVNQGKDVFSETSIEKHASERRKQSHMYAMSSLVSYEPFVDKVNGQLMAKLTDHARAGRTFDLFTWMQFYAFDVIGEITFGRSLGLLEAGYDKDGLLHAAHTANSVYGFLVGIVHDLHPWILRLHSIVPYDSHWRILIRVALRELGIRMQGSAGPSDRRDFIDKCIDQSKAGKMDHNSMVQIIATNVGAGSDTTGISLTAIVYYLMKNPDCLRKLREEIDAAAREGTISDPVTFQEGQKLQYMQATIKEALRLHPAIGQILSRVVPEGGAELAGRHFPQGTVVGINPWVAHSDEDVWGADLNEFRPERWLESKEKVAILEQHMLSFGAGSRTCIGKNISLLEMTKVLPQLVRKFDFVTAGPSEWKIQNGWFVKQYISVKAIERP